MDNRLIYLPLGGAGEIGMNSYVYGYGAPGEERLILVDLGVAFPDMETTPGIELVFPDMSWLIERSDRLEAIFVTHAHEDHIGAVSHFWPQLGRPPVYARNFTGHVLRQKMEERGLDKTGVKIIPAWPERVEAGPFSVGFLPVSHSVPESSALVVDNPKGRILHTGDFKIDSTPVVGDAFDQDLWSEVAKPRLHALVCDSTNVLSDHPGRSEGAIGGNIQELLESRRGLVVATTFASNVARLKTLAEAGTRAGRRIALLGRAMRRMTRIAEETGVLTGFPAMVDIEEIRNIPRGEMMVLATGSQGEPRAASAQLSRGKHHGLVMREGDLFLFSSKTIPGNERGVLRVINRLSAMGVDIIGDNIDSYHVSGHANRPDLVRIHELTKPGMVIPMHGEHRHLREHAELARENGYASVVAVNGTMLDLSRKVPSVAEHVETGRSYLDGTVRIGATDGVVRDRIRMALYGLAVVTVFPGKSRKDRPEVWVDLVGLPESTPSGEDFAEILEREIEGFLRSCAGKKGADEEYLEKEIRRFARQLAQARVGKKPEVLPVIVQSS